jgi:hypothetical protein
VRRLALIALLLWPMLAGAELKITGPTTVAANQLVRLRATGMAEGAGLSWSVSNDDLVDAEEAGAKYLFTAPPGVYKVTLLAISVDKSGKAAIDKARATVTIGTPTPTPGPAPGPGPSPDPPPPIESHPTVGIPKRLKVLIVYESAELAKIPAAQLAVLYSKDVRDYLNAHCDKEASGKAGWRIWDKDIDASADLPEWQKAIKRDRRQVPWIVISNPKTGCEVPLPATVDATMALLRKYGGA